MTSLSVIFDLDGTLLDTLHDIAETANTVLAHHQYPIHKVDAYRTFVGEGLRVLMQSTTPPDTSEVIINNCCLLFLELYAEKWTNTCRPYDGINEMLLSLQARGLKMAVLSNKPHAFTKLFIDKFFSDTIFSCVYGQRQGFAKKPDPTVALEIARQLKVHPHSTLFVGDTIIDVLTGKAAGMTTIGVTWGFRNRNELQTGNPDIIINSPMELLQYV